MSSKIVYMIRRKSDGLYSTGGMAPSFTKRGKVWVSIGNLKNHLNQAICDGYYSNNTIQLSHFFKSYLDCEIVSFEIVQKESDVNPPFELKEYFNKKLQNEYETHKNSRYPRKLKLIE